MAGAPPWRPPGTSKSALYMQHLKKFYPEKYRELMDRDRELRKNKAEEIKALKENLLVFILMIFSPLQKKLPQCKGEIGATKFYHLRPETVRKIGSLPPQTCAYIYCLNVDIKIRQINSILSKTDIAA